MVHRAVRTAREWVGDRLIGLVDNMTGYVCGHCGELGPLFPQANSRELSAELAIPYLGSVPFDPKLAAACDMGQPIGAALEDSLARVAIEALATRIVGELEARQNESRQTALKDIGS